MQESVALVTGAGKATGIGFETCRQLARAGYVVFLSARKEEDAAINTAALLEEGLDVRALGLDVTRPESIRAAKEALPRLDVLVNNAAGVGPYGETALDADLQVSRGIMETTLFGTWALIQALLPLLEKSPSPRIVNVSSGAGSHGDPAFGLATANAMGTSYGVAKAALNALTTRLAFELRDKRILVNAVCPGFTATFQGSEAMGARPVAEGAAGIVWAATLPDDGPSGGFFRDGGPLPW